MVHIKVAILLLFYLSSVLGWRRSLKFIFQEYQFAYAKILEFQIKYHGFTEMIWSFEKYPFYKTDCQTGFCGGFGERTLQTYSFIFKVESYLSTQ